MPDISVGPNEAPEFAALARKAVSMMSLEEVLGRMVVEIVVVWILSGMVRALVEKFGDAARKVTHESLAAPDLSRARDTIGSSAVCLRTLPCYYEHRVCQCCRCCCAATWLDAD